MTKRIIAILFAAIIIVALVGCGSNRRDVIKLTLSTEDATAILNAAGIRLPDADNAAGAGTTVKWFAHYDVFQNYSEDEVVNTGAWTFIEKYGGSFKWVETLWENRFTDLAALLLSGDAPDLFPGENAIFPYYAIQGMFQPVNDYIDYDDPLWSGMKDYAEKYFNLGGKIYAAVYNANYGTIVPYNRRVIGEWGFEDPYELFINDEWTWDVMKEMCFEFSEPDEDRYAIDGFFFTQALMYSTGKSIIELDPEACQFYSNIDDPGLERAENLLAELARNECVFPRWTQTNWSCRDNNTNGAGVKTAQCLFYAIGTWGFGETAEIIEATWGDLDDEELMFVPMARDPLGDGNYYIESTADAYAIINGSKNVEGAALVCACERFKALDPIVKAIDRNQIKQKLKWSDDMLDMDEICHDLVTSGHQIVAYGDGMGSTLATINAAFVPAGFSNNQLSWAQLKEANQDRLQYSIDEFNEKIQAFINGEEVDLS